MAEVSDHPKHLNSFKHLQLFGLPCLVLVLDGRIAAIRSMKHFLLSIGISLALIIGYLTVTTVIVLASTKDWSYLDPAVVASVDKPLRLPKAVSYYFFPPTAKDFSTSTNLADMRATRVILALSFFVVNVLIYAVPVYVLLILGSKYWKRRHHSQTQTILPLD